MVLNVFDRRERGDRSDQSDQSHRGQVLILIAVVIALVVISSAIVLNSGILATVDRSEGVSMTPTDGTTTISDLHDGMTASIVTANRKSLSQTHLEDELIAQQAVNSSEAIEYHGHKAAVTIEDVIDGTRVYSSSQSELTGAADENWTVIANPNELTGGIEIDADSVSNAEPLHIEAGNHDVWITDSGEDATTATVQTGSETKTYTSSQSHPFVDLGEGSFDGYQFESYDQTDINQVQINNGSSANGTVELVVTDEVPSFDPVLTVQSDATFGVIYSVAVQTDRQTTEIEYIATHGPTRGEF